MALPQPLFPPGPAPRPPKRRRYNPLVEPLKHPEAAAVVSEQVAADLLDRANAKILQSAGYTGCTKLAGERLRQMAEDFYFQMLHQIRLFATAGRRTKPTALDFQKMFEVNKIPLSFLEEEMVRFPSRSHEFGLLSEATEMPPDEAEFLEALSETKDVQGLLGEELDGSSDKRDYIPDYFPSFPSKHTYLETPVFTERPREPRVIREMATREAELAENALRKLLAVSAAGGIDKPANKAIGLSTKRKERDEVWERTLKKLKDFEEYREKERRETEVEINGMNLEFSFPSSTGRNKEKEMNGSASDVWLEVVVNADREHWRGGTSKMGIALSGKSNGMLSMAKGGRERMQP